MAGAGRREDRRSPGKIVRDQLERAKAGSPRQSFMRLAGSVRGPRDLSSRKGFARRLSVPAWRHRGKECDARGASGSRRPTQAAATRTGRRDHSGLSWDDDRNLLDNPDCRGLGWPQLRWMFTAFHLGHYIPLIWP